MALLEHRREERGNAVRNFIPLGDHRRTYSCDVDKIDTMADISPIIELHDARIFQRENLVLNHVDLTVNAGEFIYLVGRTGSGKSSLMRTLYGDLPLQEGEGHVAGYDLRKLKRRQIPYLRRKIGIVFQDFQLLGDRTVNENLLFVMRSTGWKA